MAIIKMILLIGLLIFVHELGHFLVAKMFKMKVERFCFGLPFGPVLYEKKIGDVTYGVHWLFFLGGYVSFPDDNKENGLPPDSPELFKNKPIYQRACVLLAGVTANLITAYLIVIFCCLHWHMLPSGQYDLFISGFTPDAKIETLNSGMKSGDKIYSINGKEVEYPNELQLVIQASKKFDNKITQIQYDKVLNEFLTLNPDYNSESILKNGDIVKLPKTVLEDKIILTDNQIFGLKNKEKYIELNEEQQEIRNEAYGKENYKVKEDIPLTSFVQAISDTYSPINIVVQRGENKIQLPVLYSGDDGMLGIIYSKEERVKNINSFGQAIIESHDFMWKNTKLTIKSLKLLFTGQVPRDKIAGVIVITKVGSEIIAKSGMFKGLLLTALISLSLAIFNILPIPALDGGHLMFLIIEKIKGSPLEEKTIEKISNIFFYILITLILLIIGNDIWLIWVQKLY